MQIIINAGGQGTRLWPISTKQKPKQFCELISGKSLLQITFERLLRDFSTDQIWVSTNQDYFELVKNQLPQIKPSHILCEPERRDTFPAVTAHSSIIASQTSDDESIIFINSDHYIAPEQSIKNHNLALKKIDQELRLDNFDLMVAGIKPSFPSTNYGYIEIASKDTKESFEKGVKVIRFKEKPNLKTAKHFLDEKNYFWNFGSFSFKYSKLLKILETTNPESLDALKNIYKNKKIDIQNFRQLEKTSFDYAVLEKIKNLGMVSIELKVWDDIGSFDTLYNYLPHIISDKELYKNQEETNKNHYQVGGSGNKVKVSNQNRKVAFVGVSNLVLIETDEGILVVDPNSSAMVKDVANYF
jgi:mannose-1-phosphate guanylyltransferase